MKRGLAFILALAMMLGMLAGCGGNTSQPAGSSGYSVGQRGTVTSPLPGRR